MRKPFTIVLLASLLPGCGARDGTPGGSAFPPQDQKTVFESAPVPLPAPPVSPLQNQITQSGLVPAPALPVLPANFGDLMLAGHCLGLVSVLSLSTLSAAERTELIGETVEKLFQSDPFKNSAVLLRLARILQLMQNTSEYAKVLTEFPERRTEPELDEFLTQPFLGAIATFKTQVKNKAGEFEDRGFHSILVSAMEKKGRVFNFALVDPNLPGLPLQFVFDAGAAQFYFSGYPESYAHVRYTFESMKGVDAYHQALAAGVRSLTVDPKHRELREFVGLSEAPGIRGPRLGDSSKDFLSWVAGKEALSLRPEGRPGGSTLPSDPVERSVLLAAQIQLEHGCGNFKLFLKALRERPTSTGLFRFVAASLELWMKSDTSLNINGKYSDKHQPAFQREWARCLKAEVRPLLSSN